ncbi:tail fiber protein [Paenibacillus sp. FSL H8-0317]|uniref:tail fiber protein n=1 Tax=Paenibacillus sp. FSL H8-0317 TaxID=2921385 RepID=UPI003247A51B
MAFTQKVPEWHEVGTEPSEVQKQTGFQPGMKPPAQWFNWFLNWTYLALKELQEKAAEQSNVDFALEEIQADIIQLQDDIGNADIPDASLTVKGKVQLSNKIDGGSESLAPTEKALNDARLVAQKYVDDKTWQKYKLTEDNGDAQYLALADLNNITTPGIYYVGTATNRPGINTNYYVEVIRNYSGSTLQRVTLFNSNEVYTRQKATTTTWTPWVLQTPEENLWGAL